MAKTEESQDTVKSVKAEINEAKKALTTYFKENKLKKNEDYSEDKKHGKKISRLEKAVEKAQEKLKTVKEASKGTGTRATKYEYPDDITTAAQRKKYRQEQRALAKGDKPKKAKKEKPAKEEKSKKSKVEKTEEAPKAKKEKSGKKSKKAKKSKKDD